MGAELIFVGPVHEVAPTLLGAVLSHAGVSVRITEVEAYAGIGLDAASHAHRGLTPRTIPMFGPVGHAYVYLSYGLHRCLNVVSHPVGEAGAVLIRGGEVIDGLDLARSRRPGIRDRELARGPGCLTRALDITLAHSGADLRRDPFTLEAGPVHEQIRTGPRIGISKAVDVPWRFWLEQVQGSQRE